MKRGWMLFVLAVLCGALETQGAIVTVLDNPGSNSFDDFSTPGLLAVDPDFQNNLPLTLSIELEAGDLSSPLAFNSVVDNLTGGHWLGYTLTLDGASWEFIGDADAGPFGSLTGISPPSGPAGAGVTQVRLSFFNEPDGFTIGDPLGLGAANWAISLSGLTVGDSFTLTLQPEPVPEPGTISIALAGIVGLAGAARSRKGKAQVGA